MGELLTEIYINEVVQAGDVYMLHFFCPFCTQKAFGGYPLSECPECDTSLRRAILNLPKNRAAYRLLGGTRRKFNLKFYKKTIASLREIQGDCCAYCDKNLRDEQFHIDHVIPLSFGGSNRIDNLAISCPPCNLFLGMKVFENLMHKRLYVQQNLKRLVN